MDTYTEDLIDFGIGAACISGAQKFIIPIPHLSEAEGEPLVHPGAETIMAELPEADWTDHIAQAGQTIKDWGGKPVEGRGIVFLNGEDNSWQAARGNGNEVIIMNQVTKETADALDTYIHTTLGHQRGEEFSFSELKSILAYARTELGIKDMYNSDKPFITDKMSRAAETDNPMDFYGLYKRDDRDICQAIYIPRSGAFEGPAVTRQIFAEGVVIVTQPGTPARLVQPRIFQETYKKPGGSELEVTDLAMYYRSDDEPNAIDILKDVIQSHYQTTLRDIIVALPDTVREAYRYRMPLYSTLGEPNIHTVKTATVGAFTVCYGKRTRARTKDENVVVVIERSNKELGVIGGYVQLGSKNTAGEQPIEGAVRKFTAEAIDNNGHPVITPKLTQLHHLTGGLDYRIPELPVGYYGHKMQLEKGQMKALEEYSHRLETDADYRTAVAEKNNGEISQLRIIPVSEALQLDRSRFTHPHEFDAIVQLSKDLDKEKAGPGR